MINSIKSPTKKNAVQAWLSTRLEADAIQYLALAGITLFALVMRFYKLGEWGLWIDEVLTLRYIEDGLHRLWTPTSFRLIALSLPFLGVSDWSLRVVPAILGVISLPVLYFPTRKLFGPAVALLSVLLLALSPWHLYWSQNARFYTALMLFYTLGVFAFYYWLEKDRLAYLFLAGVFLLLAVLERMNAVLFGPAAGLYILALFWLPFGRPAGLRWRNLLLLAAPVVVFAAYQVLVLGMVGELTYFIFGRNHNPLRVLLSIVYDIGLPLFIIAMVGGAYLLLQKSRAGLYVVLNAVVPVILLVAISPFTQTFSRYVFMTLPLWAILGAVAVKELVVQAQNHTRLLALGLLALLLVEPLSQDVLYYTYQRGNREDFKSAFAQVEQNWSAGDLVVSTRPEVAEYYLDVQAIDSNRIDLDGIVAGDQRAWFVMDSRTHISDELQSWLNESTSLKGVYDVHQPGKITAMRVYLFDPVRGQ